MPFASPQEAIKQARATQFQKSVWHAIATIPSGQTRSYRWLAEAIGRPRALRAVANACGQNPFPVLVPCHRVIASDGSLGGYSGAGGIARKKQLLAMESNEKARMHGSPK